jgi:hypothetical protein
MCYCCKPKAKKVTLGLLSGVIFIPSILLFIFGGLMKNSFKFLGKNTGEEIGNIAVGITLFFAGLAFLIALLGGIVGCCY